MFFYVMTRIISSEHPDAICEAASVLLRGGLVGLPTETVYGLAANALDGKAVARIFAAKGRPHFNPLIIHCHTLEQISNYVQLNDDAINLSEAFWPGPMTLILPRKKDCKVSELASAGLSSLAVRIPRHPIAMAVLRQADVPLAAPSANSSGTISPTSASHVVQSLGNSVDLVLASGSCKVGLESTVLDLTADKPVILRPGVLTADDFLGVLKISPAYEIDQNATMKSPGLLLKHYAPTIPIRLNAIDLDKGEALLGFGSLKFMGVRGGGFASDLPEESICNLSETGDLYEAAANLFSMMRALDNSSHKGIAVMSIPDKGVGIAINDRLRRAARG